MTPESICHGLLYLGAPAPCNAEVLVNFDGVDAARAKEQEP